MANLKYDETFPVKVAEYAAKGDTDARIASRLGVALSTFYSYKEQFPEFAEGLLAGRRICYSRVRSMLLKVARGQCKLTTKVFKDGKLYKTTERNLPPNLKAIIYFQKHMRVGEVKPSAQQDSGISNFGRLSGELCWPHGHKTENTPAQADSGMSNLKVESENAPAQADSGNSNLGMGLIGPMGPIGLMGQKPVMQSSPAQADSGMSNLGAGRTGRTGLTSPTSQTAPAQADSGNSILE